MLGLRASDLAVREEMGVECVAVTGGMGDGLPVSMDERTESRKLILALKANPNAQISVAERSSVEARFTVGG